MFNCLKRNAPAYLTELLSNATTTRNLRSAGNVELTYAVPFNNVELSVTGGFERTAGFMLWKKLPLSVRESDTLDTFKKNLKTFYFRNYYSFF